MTLLEGEFNPDNISEIQLNASDIPNPPLGPTKAPTIASVKTEIIADEPQLVITGSNFTTDTSEPKPRVRFQLGNSQFEANLVTISEANNLEQLTVDVPNNISLGTVSGIEVIRSEKVNNLPGSENETTIEFASKPFSIEPNGEYILGVSSLKDELVVINRDIQDLTAKIAVEDNPRERNDWLQDVAVTAAGDRAYVVLKETGTVALVDTVLLRQVDANLDANKETIVLPAGAKPNFIAIGEYDQFAYIADSNNYSDGRGRIYVLDLNPNSVTYNQHVETIELDGAPLGIQQIDIDPEGKILYAVAPNKRVFGGNVEDASRLYAINVDLADKDSGATWHGVVARTETGNGETITGAYGVQALPDSEVAVTNLNSQIHGFQVFTLGKNGFEEKNTVGLTLGSFRDYFDVNNAKSIAITNDLEYGFVAASNYIAHFPHFVL